jgi:dipeptidase E
MRLYLSSFDIGDCPEELVALARGAKRAAIIVDALDNRPEGRAKWLKLQTEKLGALGFVTSELDLRAYFGKADELEKFLRNIDVVWINGGNAFILRRAMKQSGFDTHIKEALARDEIVYGGFSAAAVIVSNSLRGLEIVDDPYDAPPGYDRDIVWEGLGLLAHMIAVHFKSSHSESSHVDKEIAFFEANGIPYRTLRDGEVLIVDGEKQRVVGL